MPLVWVSLGSGVPLAAMHDLRESWALGPNALAVAIDAVGGVGNNGVDTPAAGNQSRLELRVLMTSAAAVPKTREPRPSALAREKRPVPTTIQSDRAEPLAGE
jgi:hypothetical protein